MLLLFLRLRGYRTVTPCYYEAICLLLFCFLKLHKMDFLEYLRGTKPKEIDEHVLCFPFSLLRSMGSLQQSLVCFEKRLVVAHELGGEGGGKAQAYWELGTLHSQLGNYEQALSCLEHQLNIARTAGVRSYLHKGLFYFLVLLNMTNDFFIFIYKSTLCAVNVLNPALTLRINPWKRRRAMLLEEFIS